MNATTRARTLGAVIVLAAFAVGVVVGRNLPPKFQEGVMITVTGTDRIPAELETLNLSDSQRVLIREYLRAGTQRVDRVVEGFTLPMDAAVDSTDREIRSVLTPQQVAKLDSNRVAHPLKRMHRERIIDSTHR